MKIPEAIALLDGTKAKDKPSRINQSLTENQAIEIIRRGIECCKTDANGDIADWMEKRVHQVTRNQRRPRY